MSSIHNQINQKLNEIAGVKTPSARNNFKIMEETIIEFDVVHSPIETRRHTMHLRHNLGSKGLSLNAVLNAWIQDPRCSFEAVDFAFFVQVMCPRNPRMEILRHRSYNIKEN